MISAERIIKNINCYKVFLNGSVKRDRAQTESNLMENYSKDQVKKRKRPSIYNKSRRFTDISDK